MSTGISTESNATGAWCLVVTAIAILVVLFSFVSRVMSRIELPSLDQVIPQTHAVERHGQDAIMSRSALAGCKVPMSKLCPGKAGSYGLTVVFWCETGKELCPGMYTTIGGVEKTTFIRPCSQWRNCQ